MINGQIEAPLRKRIKLKEKKTSADPTSGCNIINNTGAAIIDIEIKIDLKLFNLIDGLAKKLLSDKQVANFANSEGCRVNPPILIHDLAPLNSLPTSNTNTSKTKLAP